MDIKLRELKKLVAMTFSEGERVAIQTINDHLPNANEEEITIALNIELSRRFEDISRSGLLRKSIAKDLMKELDWHYRPNVEDLTRGLVAKVTRHPKHIEKRTGGDMGVVLIEPQFVNSNNHINVERRGRQHGILVQAKLKRIKPWGKLTQKQKESFESVCDFYVILRYEYADGTQLSPFKWNSCKGNSLDIVESWLGKKGFPESLNTENLILKLMDDKVGTTKKKIIDSFIIPSELPVICLNIDWDDGSDPDTALERLNRQLRTEKPLEQQHIRLMNQ